ncbi:uncharacterized protein Pyn_11401 [Prunus yedoensis var. nudiflora]|uniref:GRF-type domain-containing protein n=1 Tax=Prunus yedoensis var. nudiflora TaxID=2094558 RepID=A0A314Y9X5_PRUYE|nr:uncharacterized protein Pyn_11401 [Prunus yedoensis var. nudiflora]
MSGTRRCFCGGFARLETSWTKDNPRRRFWTCCRKKGCGYFDWFDPQMCARLKMIIPRLLKRIDKPDDELKRSHRREKLLWFFIVIDVLIAMLSTNANEHKGSSGNGDSTGTCLMVSIDFCVL